MIYYPGFEESIYLQEVKTQCNSVLFALEQFNKRIEEVTQPGRFEDRDTPSSEVFRALHSLLTHAANISRLLFPTRTSDRYAQRRGKRLRVLLGVRDDSPIADRSLRNHLEHYDERLDRWAQNNPGPSKSFATDNIHPKDMGPNVPPDSALRAYLTDSREFYFMGDAYEMVPLVREVRRILEEVEKIPGVW